MNNTFLLCPLPTTPDTPPTFIEALETADEYPPDGLSLCGTALTRADIAELFHADARALVKRGAQ